MSIYIDMEMPKDSDMIVIYSDCTARKYLSYTKVIIDEAKAISIPPHGRLIDADAVFKRLQKQAMSVWGNGNPRYQIVLEVMDAIRFAPTIIPASWEGET